MSLKKRSSRMMIDILRSVWSRGAINRVAEVNTWGDPTTTILTCKGTKQGETVLKAPGRSCVKHNVLIRRK
jgi:hypothetical protein